MSSQIYASKHTDCNCRVNLGVQLANSIVSPHMIHAEVHPKISDNGVDRGQYPREFEHPRRVEWFVSLDSALPLFFSSPPPLSHIQT